MWLNRFALGERDFALVVAELGRVHALTGSVEVHERKNQKKPGKVVLIICPGRFSRGSSLSQYLLILIRRLRKKQLANGASISVL